MTRCLVPLPTHLIRWSLSRSQRSPLLKPLSSAAYNEGDEGYLGTCAWRQIVQLHLLSLCHSPPQCLVVVEKINVVSGRIATLSKFSRRFLIYCILVRTKCIGIFFCPTACPRSKPIHAQPGSSGESNTPVFHSEMFFIVGSAASPCYFSFMLRGELQVSNCSTPPLVVHSVSGSKH